MRSRPFLRCMALAAAALVLLAGCGRTREDEQELRGFLQRAERQSRAFSLVEAAKDRWFSLRGRMEDDLRYAFTLSSPRGPVLQAVVQDDALAVRLLQPAQLARYASSLGHPATVRALLAGRWVLDPAGAPPLAPPRSDADAREAPDPLEAGARVFRTVHSSMAQSSEIKEFNLEDIEYKPSQDPWKYPNADQGEKRYDLIRPKLPTREEQAQQSQITIGEPYFRKTSVFTKRGQIYQLCQMVDVEGHEEFVRLRERKTRNSYLESILKQVREGRTETPVRPRSVYTAISYPESVATRLPTGAMKARLDVFLTGLRQAFKGVLAPPGPVPAQCLRGGDEQGAGAQ